MSIVPSAAQDSATRELRASIESEIAETLAAMQRTRAEQLNDSDLAWLALVPVWTLPLANRADFHGGGEALQAFLESAEALGLVAQQRPEEFVSRRVAEALHRNLDHQFWMPEAERVRVLKDLRNRRGPSALLKEMSDIVSRVPAETSVPALDQWRELARLSVEEGLSASADKLRQIVRGLLEGQESGAALGWLRTGSLLAQALGGQLEAAVTRGRREVEVAYRQAHDRRALVGFLEREEQIRAFAELVEGPNDRWALHFLGMGGAGKTMLIRHINAELAGRYKRIIARVDFDYISPNYPLLHPEQLLVELADELRAYSAPEDFARFDTHVRTLQETMSQRSGEAATGDPLESSEFQSVLRAFNSWLAKLPDKVVLILDTCEELAKHQPGGEMAPSIRATYRILESLHAANPSLRVIFAGRRPLALSGHGWKLKTDALPEGRRHLPPGKDYLRLHLVRGFTNNKDDPENEADKYFRGQGVSASGDLRTAILENSRESPAINDLIEGEEVGREPRSNPFDLSLYVQWLREPGELTAKIIRSGRTDPYIDLRIARRLTDSVRDLLPAIAFLQRFDEAMLRPAAPRVSDADFGDIFREISEQEWIDYKHDPSVGTFLEVDRNLHPRLFAYFTANSEQRRLLDHARRQLAPGLAQLVRERIPAILPRTAAGAAPQRELGFDLVHASLRALDAEAAADLWEEIEARLIATGRWDWAATITGRLLGEQEAGQLDVRLRPAILATQASAMLHTEPGPSVANAWENVLALAGEARPADRATALENRAWLGKIAASQHEVITTEDVKRLKQLWEQLDDVRGSGACSFEQVAAALYAATERVVDAIESGGEFGLLNVRNPASLPADSVSPELLAFGFTLCSRLHRDLGRRAEAGEAAHAAAAIARADPDRPAQRWAGWNAPESIEDFARLEELLYFRWFAEFGASGLLESWTRPVRPAQVLDVERLLSLYLELRLGSEVVGADALKALEADDRYNGPPKNERAAHREVAPLVVNLALGWLARGDTERALSLLEARIRAAKAAGPDPQMILQCEQAKLRVFSRMRLRRRGESLMERSLDAPELAPLGWPARALNGMPLPEVPPGEGEIPRQLVHAWWRSRVKSDDQSNTKLADAAEKVFRRDEKKAAETDTAVMFADYAECDWLRVGGLPARWGSERPDRLEQAIGDLRDRSALPCRELARLDLRLAAFCRESWLPDTTLLGRRRLAEIALEEGELLALRLPDLALRPLDIAYAYFAGAINDRVGALIAAICGATAALRGNRKGIMGQGLREKVRPAYERLVSDGSWRELPSWQELEDLASNPRGDFQRLNHPVWGGWLHRLFRCLLVVEEGKTEKQFGWLARQYLNGVPAELGFTPKEIEFADKMRRRAANPDRVLRACLRWSAILLLLVLVLIIAGLAVSKFSNDALGPFLVVLLAAYATGGVIGVLQLVLLGAAAIKTAAGIYAGRCRLAVVIDLEKGLSLDFSATHPVQMRILGFNKRRASRPARDFKISALLPGLRRYQEAAAEVPSEIVDLLTRMRERLIGNSWANRLAVSIIAPSNASSTAWEALLALCLPAPIKQPRMRRVLEFGGRVLLLLGGLAAVTLAVNAPAADKLLFSTIAIIYLALGVWAVRGSWRSPGDELHFYREGEARDAAQRSKAWKSKLLRSASSRKWQLLVEQGWPALRAKALYSGEALGQFLSPLGRLGDCAIVHAIGRVLNSTAGLQLEIGEDDSLEEQAAESSGSTRRLIGVEDLRLHEAALFVIQGEPLTDFSNREDSDRESAALLRAFGAELFAAGAEAVLVLPSLNAPVAEAALRVIAKRFAGSRPPDLRRMLDAVADARKTIRDWPAPPKIAANAHDLEWFRHDQLEAALDICLFARTDLPPLPSETIMKA